MDRVEIGGNLYIRGDCVQGCREMLADNSVDLLIADPPYGIDGQNLHRHYLRNENYVIDGYIEVPAAEYQQFTLSWVREAERVLRPGGLLYIISGYTRLYEVLHALRQTRLTEVNHLIWKYNFGVFTRRKFISSHYHILYYAKQPLGAMAFNLDARFGLEEKDSEGASLNYRDREDVWTVNREYKPRRSKNKNELPLALLVKMLQYSSREGDLVCDLFMGGFTAAKACVGLGRRFVGFELSEQAFAHQVGEMKKLQPGYLLRQLRVPPEGILKQRGKRWTEEERQAVIADYRALLAAGQSKQAARDALGQKYLRGRWALARLLKSEAE